MPQYAEAKPQISVRLFKTISRKTIDGQEAVSSRYEGKDESIDLTPFLNEGSGVVTRKSVRDPAGAFSITFADRPHQSVVTSATAPVGTAFESIYGLVEPMDMIEIRMWSGLGAWPSGKPYPIKMRGFVSDVSRSQAMTDNGVPVRQVVVSGHDYGKIWQTLQVIYLNAYANGKPLLTSMAFSEFFGTDAENITKAADFVKKVMEGVINPHLKEFVPENSSMPKEILLDDLTVKHGVINTAYESAQGSVYDILRTYADVGVWNELYTEDREDGVHCVYRAIPALSIGDNKLIQDDAPEPVYVDIPDSQIQSISTSRSDANVANFYWVFSMRADMNTEVFRKTAAITGDDKTAFIRDYPNAAYKYYGIRSMYGETQMGDDSIENATTGQDADKTDKSQKSAEDWITNRRRLMMEMNKDNVVFERGTIRFKGGPMREDGVESMKAGDYARIMLGTVESIAYAVEIVDEFTAFQSYTTSITFERGTGFAKRASMEGGSQSPWLAEQASR